MTAYVTEFKTASDLAAELLTETGVTVPAHRGDGPYGVWIRERRYDIDYLADQLNERDIRHIASLAMRDDAFDLLAKTRAKLQHAAAELADELFDDWCAEGAA